jgi:hypothetical protein
MGLCGGPGKVNFSAAVTFSRLLSRASAEGAYRWKAISNASQAAVFGDLSLRHTKVASETSPAASNWRSRSVLTGPHLSCAMYHQDASGASMKFM